MDFVDKPYNLKPLFLQEIQQTNALEISFLNSSLYFKEFVHRWSKRSDGVIPSNKAVRLRLRTYIAALTVSAQNSVGSLKCDIMEQTLSTPILFIHSLMH